MRMMRTLLWIVARIVPAPFRNRWTEEWRAEIEHAAARGLSARARLSMVAGSVPDALATRRIASDRRRQTGPRAGIFHALDQDLRYALRGLLKSPGFAAGVTLSLAIGIGANVAAFSFINAVVFRSFPGVHAQHELVRITLGSEAPLRFSTVPVTYEDYVVLRQHFSTLTGVAAHRDARFAIYAEGRAVPVFGALVSSNYFDVLGVMPVAGRLFLGESDGPAGAYPLAVISDALWEDLYARAPSAVGQRLIVNGQPLEIAGVAPPAFIGLRRSEQKRSIWIPMSMAALTLRDRDGRPARIEAAGPLWLDFAGRRRAGASLDQVNAEAATVRERLTALRGRPRARVAALRVWMNDPAGMGAEIASFMIVPFLVLAIACVNAANLVLARAGRSIRDWTVRMAVGATRWRVVRQVLVEAVILATVAAALGLMLAQWGLAFFAGSVPVPMPVDARVAVFTLTVTIVAAVTFCLGPALHVTARTTTRLANSSASIGSVRSRMRFALVTLQAALSLGLLATGAQFTKTVQTAAKHEHIPKPESLVLASFNVDPLRFAPETGEDFYARLLDRVRRVPGVAAASIASNGIVVGGTARDNYTTVWTADSDPAGTNTLAFHVSPEFFTAIAVPMKHGRGFNGSDGGSVRTVVVNTAFANKMLGGRALGRSIRLTPPPLAPADGVEAGMVIIRNGVPAFPARGTPQVQPRPLDVTIVGVVDGILKREGLEPPIVYYPSPLVYQPARTLYLRLDGARTFTAAALHAAIRETDARVPAVDVSTLAEIRMRRDMELRLLTRAVTVLGVLALALAAGGLYSVVAYLVSLRRQEVGIRLALGADTGSIVSMIVRQALGPTVIGAVLGAAGAAATGALIRSRMYGTSPVDPVAFGAATLLMLTVMLLASWLPARHAGRVDPISVLRQE
jgi:putative ABC transport system permease protein